MNNAEKIKDVLSRNYDIGTKPVEIIDDYEYDDGIKVTLIIFGLSYISNKVIHSILNYCKIPDDDLVGFKVDPSNWMRVNVYFYLKKE